MILRHKLLLVYVALHAFALVSGKAHGFGPIPKPAQCISVNAMIQRNCAPVYMCNGTPDTNGAALAD